MTIANPTPDPLAATPDPDPDRVSYAIGMMLDAVDFTDEQTYHRGRLARALTALHGMGTIAGLRVRFAGGVASADPANPTEEEIVVEGGLAIDALGRLVEVPRDACIRVANWFAGQDPGDLRAALHGAPFGGVVVDLFLRFVSCERGKTPAFATGPFDALNAIAPSRVRDAYELKLVLRREGTPPVPQSPWPPNTLSEGDRRAALREAIYTAWTRNRTRARDSGGLIPEGFDQSAVFLARLVVPASAPADPNARPDRDITKPVAVDDSNRPFTYVPGAIARWLGI